MSGESTIKEKTRFPAFDLGEKERERSKAAEAVSVGLNRPLRADDDDAVKRKKK